MISAYCHDGTHFVDLGVELKQPVQILKLTKSPEISPVPLEGVIGDEAIQQDVYELVNYNPAQKQAIYRKL